MNSIVFFVQETRATRTLFQIPSKTFSLSLFEAVSSTTFRLMHQLIPSMSALALTLPSILGKFWLRPMVISFFQTLTGGIFGHTDILFMMLNISLYCRTYVQRENESTQRQQRHTSNTKLSLFIRLL